VHDVDRKKKHELRTVVAFMCLFAGSFVLDEAAHDYRARVLAVGSTAVETIRAFFTANAITARSSGTALKAFRQLHKTGALDGLIVDYTIRMEAGLIVDPSPFRKRYPLSPLKPATLV
jgi:hypothetical protein